MFTVSGRFLFNSGFTITDVAGGIGEGFDDLSATEGAAIERFVEKRAADEDTSPLKELSWLFR